MEYHLSRFQLLKVEAGAGMQKPGKSGLAVARLEEWEQK